MNVAERICQNLHVLYAPQDGFDGIFYIKPDELIFPDQTNFPPTGGRAPCKGSFFKTEAIICQPDRVEIKLKVHTLVAAIDDDAAIEEIVVDQVDIWTWHDRNEIKLWVDFPNPDGGSFGSFTADVDVLSDERLELRVISPLPQCEPPANIADPEQVSSCAFVVNQTTIKDGSNVNVDNTLKIVYWDNHKNVVAEVIVQPQYLAFSTDSHAWD
jgi:hypothetical protein